MAASPMYVGLGMGAIQSQITQVLQERSEVSIDELVEALPDIPEYDVKAAVLPMVNFKKVQFTLDRKYRLQGA